MPQKAKGAKSRTSNRSNGLKLKWWYALPVLLVVAIAGYVIVRYSNASVLTTFNKSVGNGLNTYTGTQNKSGYGKAANTPAKANITYDQSTKSKRICARVVGVAVNSTNGAQGELILWNPSGAIRKTFYAKGESVPCVINRPPYYPMQIEVKKTSGDSLYVVNIYGTSY